MILSYLRTIFLYLALIGIVRLLGKRQISQMEPSEFVVTMLASNLAAIPMQDGGIPLLAGLVPILTVLSLELILSGAVLRNLKLRKLLCGNPVVLMENGRILRENLARTRITLDELLAQLRGKNILDPTTVQYAVLETDGSLSVFPFPGDAPATAQEAGLTPAPLRLPVLIVSDGRLLEENLSRIGRDARWVDEALSRLGAAVCSTWLLTADHRGILCFYRKEEKGG